MPPSPPVKTRTAPPAITPSTPSPDQLGIAIASPHYHDAYARLVCPCLPTPRREHEHAITAAAIHRRRPCSATAPQAHHPPLGIVGPVGRVGPVPPRPSPRRRREHAGQTHQPPSRSVKGTSANTFPILRAPVQKPEGPSVNFFVISCGQGCQLVKLIGNCRKLQKWSNLFGSKLEVKLYNFG
jgi:hypothetical protein